MGLLEYRLECRRMPAFTQYIVCRLPVNFWSAGVRSGGKQRNLPIVLGSQEVVSILTELYEENRLLVQLIYRSGLRIS